MAVWQYSLHALPEDSLLRHFTSVPPALSEDDFNAQTWWENVTDQPSLEAEIAAIMPETRSWSDNLKIFGSNDGNHIDLSYEGEALENVFIRIDLREPSAEFLRALVEISNRRRWIFRAAANGDLFVPSADELRKRLVSSDAARFVQDPLGFLQGVASRQPEGPQSLKRESWMIRTIDCLDRIARRFR